MSVIVRDRSNGRDANKMMRYKQAAVKVRRPREGLEMQKAQPLQAGLSTY
ncbi:hypothetical protein LPN04_16575 [Rugamonas sp. A1-17]|nr:hypothetical protein [Rugamonas sp. A1-17]